jgi:hypothetical protein
MTNEIDSTGRTVGQVAERPEPADEIDTMLAEREKRKAAAEAERKAARRASLVRLNDLELEHGDDNVRALWAGDDLVVVKRPTKPQYDCFSDKAALGNKDQEHAERMRKALATLARQCLVCPDEVAFRELCKRHPSLEQDAGNQARSMGDDAEVVRAGKV